MRHPLFDIEIAVCGRRFHVRRSLDMLRRMEQHFGAVLPLAKRMAEGAVRIDDAIRIVDIALRDEPDRPERREIETHIFDAGVEPWAQAHAMAVYSLVMGNDAIRRVHKARGGPDPEPPDEDDRPFSRAA